MLLTHEEPADHDDIYAFVVDCSHRFISFADSMYILYVESVPNHSLSVAIILFSGLACKAWFVTI